jgi:hypothetical protein
MTSLASEEDAQSPQQQQALAAINKINNMGKFVGNKILDLSRKMKRQIPPSVQFTLNINDTNNNNNTQQQNATNQIDTQMSQMTIDSDTAKEQDSSIISSDSQDTSATSVDALLKLNECDGFQIIDSSFVSIQSSQSLNDDSPSTPYQPKLNQKQFQNKQQRINHIKQFTSSSNSVFLII